MHINVSLYLYNQICEDKTYIPYLLLLVSIICMECVIIWLLSYIRVFFRRVTINNNYVTSIGLLYKLNYIINIKTNSHIFLCIFKCSVSVYVIISFVRGVDNWETFSTFVFPRKSKSSETAYPFSPYINKYCWLIYRELFKGASKLLSCRLV